MWVHGDLDPGNMLAVDGRLSAVIDWGGLDIGGIPTPSPDSLSSLYFYDLQPIELINRDYYSTDGVFVRQDNLVANADGEETLISRVDSLVFEFLKNRFFCFNIIIDRVIGKRDRQFSRFAQYNIL